MRMDPFLWALLTINAVGLLASIGEAIVFWHRRRGSRSWPVTHATVEYGFTTHELQGWRTNLVYSYCAESGFYSGTRVLKAKNEADADELSRSWKGQNLTVHYSPKYSAISIIRAEEQSPLPSQAVKGA